MEHNPLISVIMPVYNGEKHLKPAIESILNQTYKNFELLLVDDASTDASLHIMQSYNDPRIRIIKNEKNLKLIKTLNKAIKLANGIYLARMDADDISLPKRLTTQVAFMKNNPDVGICGTWVKTIGIGKSMLCKTPVSHKDNVATLLFRCSLMHPTVMMRKNIIEKHGLFYDENFPHAEDYELWVRASQHTKLANIPQCLLLLRHHNEQVSKMHSDTQCNTANLIRKQLVQNIIPDVTDNELAIHNAIGNWQTRLTKELVLQAKAWLEKLGGTEIISRQWFIVCNNATKLGMWTWRIFFKSELAKNAGLSAREKLRFFVKCLLIHR